MFNLNQKKCYSSSDYVRIDEYLQAFRENCSFRQYITSKPSKYGIKTLARSDAKIYYTTHLEVYVVKQLDGPFKIDNSAKE